MNFPPLPLLNKILKNLVFYIQKTFIVAILWQPIAVNILSHTYCLPVLHDLSHWFKATLSNSHRWYQLCHHCELSECTSYAIKFNLQVIQNTTEHSKHDSDSKCMFVGCTVLLLQFMNVVLFSFLYGLLILIKWTLRRNWRRGTMSLQCRYGHFYGPWLIWPAIQFNHET
jgi:hypothetical protein